MPLWHLQNGAGRYLDPRDIAVDDAGVIWVSQRGSYTSINSSVASVLRFGLDGTFLGSDQFICPGCVFSAAESVDVLPNGEVMVVGQGGQGGAVARYAPDGTRLMLAFTSTHFIDVHHDESGGVYARTPWVETIHRIDPIDGSTLWSRPGNVLVGLGDGVLVGSGVEVSSHDGSGALRWTRALSATPSSFLGYGRHEPGGATFLVREYQATGDCRVAPALVTLDDSGNVIKRRRACEASGPTRARGIDVRPGVGVLVDLDSALVARDPDGNVRWHLEGCAFCPPYAVGSVHHTPAILTADGGAWALRGAIAPGGSWLRASRIVRLDAAGAVALEVPIVDDLANSEAARLLEIPDGVIVLTTRPGSASVRWQRVQTDGSGSSGAITVPPTARSVRFQDAAVRADGGFTVAIRHTSGELCFNVCPPVYWLAVNIARDGSESWRFEPGTADTPMVVDDDGGVYIMSYDFTEGVAALQHVSAEGTPNRRFPIRGYATSAWDTQIHGPVDGRLLINRHGLLASVRLDGTGLVRRTGFPAVLAVAGRRTLILDYSDMSTVSLVDPATLVTIETLQAVGSGQAPSPDIGRWSLLANGLVYGVKSLLGPDDIYRATLARFDTGVSEPRPLFADGFE
jgi:hypothetical protein